MYNIGDIVNNKFLILEREYKKFFLSDKSNTKVYKCKCICDGYVFESSEHNLKHMKKCAACLGKVVINGVNDIATKRPEMIKFLKNKDDAYKYYNEYVDRIYGEDIYIDNKIINDDRHLSY